jgi:hypothetical protein
MYEDTAEGIVCKTINIINILHLRFSLLVLNVKLRLSSMRHVEYLKLPNVSQTTAVAILRVNTVHTGWSTLVILCRAGSGWNIWMWQLTGAAEQIAAIQNQKLLSSPLLRTPGTEKGPSPHTCTLKILFITSFPWTLTSILLDSSQVFCNTKQLCHIPMLCSLPVPHRTTNVYKPTHIRPVAHTYKPKFYI